MPKRVQFTPAALDEPWGQQIFRRVEALGLPIEILKSNRLTGLRGGRKPTTLPSARWRS
jgi:spore photoproduct lyase